MAKLVSANLTDDKLCTLTYTTTDGEMLSFDEDAFVCNTFFNPTKSFKFGQLIAKR